MLMGCGLHRTHLNSLLVTLDCQPTKPRFVRFRPRTPSSAPRFSPVNSMTPFEQRILEVAREATDAGDVVAVTQLSAMLSFLRQDQYPAMRPVFNRLRPLYRSRLGPPPSNKGQDIDSAAVQPPRPENQTRGPRRRT